MEGKLERVYGEAVEKREVVKSPFM